MYNKNHPMSCVCKVPFSFSFFSFLFLFPVLFSSHKKMIETRMSQGKLKEIEGKIFDTGLYPYEYHSCSLGRQGYSGTAVYSKLQPKAIHFGIGDTEFDSEGRTISLDFDSFHLICTYVPNAGEAQKRYLLSPSSFLVPSFLSYSLCLCLFSSSSVSFSFYLK